MISLLSLISGLLKLFSSIILASVVFVIVRSIYLIRKTHQQSRNPRHQLRSRPSEPSPCALTVLLGSGGHTGEMIRLLSNLPFDEYSPRTYFISSGDLLSKSKITQLEEAKQAGTFVVHEIPRARRVNQSLLTSVFTTAHSMGWCLWWIAVEPLLRSSQRSSSHPSRSSSHPSRSSSRKIHPACPGLILLNGPGSAVPIALSAFVARFATGQTSSTRLIYVESLARVKRLSATGFILLPFVDCFVVQWKTLHDTILQSRLYQALYSLKLVPSITFDGWMV